MMECHTALRAWVQGSWIARPITGFDDGRLVIAQELATLGACDFESFRVGTDTFVALASAVDALVSNEPLRIFRFSKNLTHDWLELHQVLEVLAPLEFANSRTSEP